MIRNPAVWLLAAIYIYFTLEFLSLSTGISSGGEGFIQRWLMAILVVNVVVLLICTARFVTASEAHPGIGYFRPLAETVVFSFLVVPYFFVMWWISFIFLWEF